MFKTASGDVAVTPQKQEAYSPICLLNCHLTPGTYFNSSSDAQMPDIGDDRKAKINPLGANFEKKEFKALWNRINHKAAYAVRFETPELINKCTASWWGW